MNQAQQLLIRIGGTAELVAGYQGHYWADAQTSKKPRQRKGRIGRGTYGENLMAKFDSLRFEERRAKQAKRVEVRKAA